MATFFGSNSTSNITETNLGSRLYHIKEAAIGSESIVSILPDDNVVVNTCSSFGKSLLNVSTLNQLVGLINSGDSKVEVIDSATGEINFTLDNQLKLVVKNLYTEVLNELRSLNIIPATDLEYNLGTSSKRYGTGFIRKITTNSTGQISIGDGTGTVGVSSVNIGNNAGNAGTPDYSVSIGRGANQGGASASVCLGFAAGQNNNGGTGTICIGHQSGAGQGVNGVKAGGISIGGASGYNGLGTNAVAIGASTCYSSTTNDNAVSIGYEAGKNNQGANAIAIGNKAGLTTSHEKSIILNATGVDLSSSGTDRCYIAPIRSGGTGNALNYDTGSKEVLSGGNISMQTLTSQGLNPDLLNSRDIGTTSLPWNGVYCNGLIQPSASNPLSFNVNGSNRMFINSSGSLVCSTVASGASATNGGIILYNNSGNSSTRAISGGVVSNEVCGLSSQGTNAGQLRLSAGGGTDASAKVYIDMFAFNNNVMIFGTQGAERMRISGANVGIGQNAPTEILDVLGNVKISSQLAIGTSVSSNYTVDVRRTGVDAYARISGDVAKKQGLIFSDGATPTDIWTFYKQATTKTLNIYNNGTSSDLMTFTTGNLVGISNSSPTEKLDVVGNAKITGNILFDADNQRSVGSSGQALSAIHCHTGNFKSIEVHSATAGNIATSAKPFNTLFVSNIGSSGTPVQTLYADVWATSSTSGLRCANNLVLATDLALPTITWYDVNAKSMILVDTVNTTDGGKLSYDSANSEIVIGTTSPSVERVRIGANGIKTSVNILPADANRNIGSSTAKFNTTYTSTILNPDANLILGRGTTSTVNISATGMSIGSGSNPTEALNVIGNIKVSGNILPNVHNVPKIGTSNTDRFLEGWFGTVYGNGVALTSDRRLKDNIKPITNALETVMKMKPVEYKMKDRVRLHTGFIADEVKNLYNGEDWAVFVEAQDEFKTQSLQYTEIVAVLASALQEVNNRLSKVEARKLVGNSVIDTSGLTEDMVSIYQRLEALESEVNKPNEIQKPQLHRCVEISRINELFQRISNLECNESKSNSSEDFELIHSLMEKNHQQELRINELENKLNNLPRGEAKNEIEDSDTGGLSMIESLQDRLFKAEQLAIKQDKMIKKLTTAVNKLLKQSE